LNPPHAEAGGFLAHVACGPAVNRSYTINTSRVGTSPVWYSKAKELLVSAWLSLDTVYALGSRNAQHAPYPVMWAVYRSEEAK
jgi:hypothetical protein